MNKHKHLDFIQATVSRMAGNSFLLKSWSITLIAGLFALAAKDSNQLYFLIAYFCLFVFWTLNGYFLAQERRYRALYDRVRLLDEVQIDFSMNTNQFLSNKRNTWLGCMISRTTMIYYLGLAFIMFSVITIIHYTNPYH